MVLKIPIRVIDSSLTYLQLLQLGEHETILQFARDYAHAISTYADGFDYPKEIHKTPPLEMLLRFAEKEFERVFSKPPTHAVYAPARINLCGESTGFNNGKILSMVKSREVFFLMRNNVSCKFSCDKHSQS